MPVGGATAAPGEALDDAAFAALMAPFAPFEPAPQLAVGVSGGADSTALCLLAATWAWARGGGVTALIVDHRLREGSGDEAAAVARRLGGRGIAAEVLIRPGPAPAAGIQERARAARFRLLADWCRRQGVLHLLLAHHRRDQVETLRMRSLRQPDKEAAAVGMAPEVGMPAVRVLRPLLAVEPSRLRATLVAAGMPWIEDPSNRDPRFERVRLRTAPTSAGDDEWRLAEAARRARRGGIEEGEAAALLARSVSVHPAGFAWLASGFASAAPEAVACRALAALLTAIGGRAHPPARVAVERLLAKLRGGRPATGATLHGCRIVRRGDRLLVCRELRETPPPVVAGVQPAIWDGRFLVTATGPGPCGAAWVGALGGTGWRAVLARGAGHDRRGIPPEAGPALPAVFDAAGLLAVPHLGIRRHDAGGEAEVPVAARFRPLRPILAGGTFLAAFEYDTM